ncbi:MAG: TolC family protein [Rhizobacter sp.]|nr:TolC family protein [Burkholderiales bacterium]
MRHLLCVVLSASAGSAIAQPIAYTPTLREVLQAVNQSTEVRIARQAQTGAEADVLTADHAPLPVLSSKLSQIDLQNGLGAGDWIGRKRIDKGVGLDWTYERGDKRALRTNAAQRTVAATAAEAQEAVLQQMLTAQAAYYDWLAARERVQLVVSLAEAGREAVRAAQTRLKAGDLSQQDTSRIEIDAARVAADKQSAQLDLSRAVLALSKVLNRADIAAIPAGNIAWPELPNTAAPAAPSTEIGNASAAAAINARADVRAARERINAAKFTLDGAYALQKTDPTIGISFDHYPGTSTRLIELRVQIPLTWGYSYQGEKARAQSDLRQAELTEERVLRDARAELARLYEEADSLTQRTTAFETDIVPRAAQVASQAEFAYRRGALSLIDLLDARRILRTTQLEVLVARTDLAKARTALLLRTAPELLVR